MLKRLLVPVSALLLALFLSGCFLLPKEADPPELPLVTPFSGAEYSTAVVTRGDLVSAAKVGFTFSPTRRENLRFSVLGRSYGAIYVTVGAQVEAGPLLAGGGGSAPGAGGTAAGGAGEQRRAGGHPRYGNGAGTAEYPSGYRPQRPGFGAGGGTATGFLQHRRIRRPAGGHQLL